MNPGFYVCVGACIGAAFTILVVLVLMASGAEFGEKSTIICHSCGSNMTITGNGTLPDAMNRDVTFTCPNKDCRMSYDVNGNTVTAFRVISPEKHAEKFARLAKADIERMTLERINEFVSKPRPMGSTWPRREEK